MPIPQHSLHVYQKPAQGTNFIKRYRIYNYMHSIAAQGWFDTASCDIAVRSENEGQSILEQYLGCYVAFYTNNPSEPIWEGLINRIIFNSGGASYTISLDELANEVSVMYTGATNVAAQTTLADSLTSQAIYGIKQDQIELGADPSAGTQRTKLRDTILAQRAFPAITISQGQGQSNLVHFECIGIFHTLEWSKAFTALTTATTAFGTRVSTLITGNANGSTFFDATDTSQISANAATVPNQQRGKSHWELIEQIAEAGDGTNYWVCGVTPTNFNTKTRVFYYRIANSAVEYTAHDRDGLVVRNLYGQKIPPWLVVPDRGIRINDVLVGYDATTQTDPREAYIQSIQYDANTQTVQWFSADDVTARGAFMLKRGFKPSGRAFGSQVRQIVT